LAEVVAPVPVADISVPKGASKTVRFVITKDGSPVALPTANTQVIFTARAKQSDALPAIQKSFVSGGTTPLLNPDPGGITANLSVGVGVADMRLDPADTKDIDVSLLAYDVWLIDPSTDEDPILTGTLRLTPTVFRP
jgi:hypothetical protein